MYITEAQLRKIIRHVIIEHVGEEDSHEEEEEEEPMGDESRAKKVYTIAKEVSSFL